MKTADGGNTWKRMHVAQGLNLPFITALAVSPANPHAVYAAGRQAVPQFGVPSESVPDPGVSAIFKSIGGGNQPPVAKGTISKLNALVNEPISFNASASFNPDGQNTQYLWNFGDGGTSAQKIATHAYAQAGIYTVTLTVTDNQGATGQVTGQITVTSGTANRLTVNPTSEAVAAGSSQAITVTFDAQGLAEGNYQGQLTITSNGGNHTLPVRILVSNAVSVDDHAVELPRTFRLEQNYPNPFSAEGRFRLAGNPETAIRYLLPFDSEVTLSIYDLSGRLVAQLQNGKQQAGEHVAPWDGRDQAGAPVANGVYFYRLRVVTIQLSTQKNYKFLKKSEVFASLLLILWLYATIDA